MRLVSVQVQNYKCIEDSGKFSVRSHLTCLAGKNESGKTALLQALRRLNPVEESESQFDTLMEYPRRRLHEADEGSPSAREVLTTEWELSDEDLAVIESSVGPCAIRNRTVTIKRGYDNRTEWDFELDNSGIVPFVASKITELSELAKEKALAQSSLGDLHSHLTSLGEPNEGETLLHQYIEEHFPSNEPKVTVTELLESRLPRFLYFPTYGTLPGRVQVEEIASKAAVSANQTEGDRFFLALLTLAGTDVAALRDAPRIEDLKAKLEVVSNRLSDEIFEYWTQNQYLQVEFDYNEARPGDPPPFNNGHVFDLRVRNARHRVTVAFDQRSAGFVWFFSFLVWFSQMERKYGDNLIILLDEPGLSLHGKAQGDLLRYMKEKLLPKYQVIYSTHSPFMVDTDNILSVCTVEDTVSKAGAPIGTKVSDRILSADADTLLPLRAALGYDITQSLFVGEHSLLVEGPSDLLFINWASRQLVARGDVGLDSRWTVTPVGGIDKFGSFNALFAANELHVAILTDFHTGDKRKVREMRESGLLKAGHVFTASEFADQDEADTEDMLTRELYVELINRRYELEGTQQIPAVRPDDAPALVLEEVKQHFRTVVTEGPEFDHMTPAVYLVEHESDFNNADGLDEALGRFGKFFQSVNALLPPS